MLTFDVQDVISRRMTVPHHVGDGYATMLNPVRTGVRRINVPVRVVFRPDRSHVFEPGGPYSNIEFIEAMAILLNDALPPPDISAYIDGEPPEFDVELAKWREYVRQDSMPSNWFIQYKSEYIFRVRLHIIHEAAELASVDPGTAWGEAIVRVQKSVEQHDMQKAHLEDAPRPIRAPIQPSPPAHTIEDKPEVPIFRGDMVDDFILSMEDYDD